MVSICLLPILFKKMLWLYRYDSELFTLKLNYAHTISIGIIGISTYWFSVCPGEITVLIINNSRSLLLIQPNFTFVIRVPTSFPPPYEASKLWHSAYESTVLHMCFPYLSILLWHCAYGYCFIQTSWHLLDHFHLLTLLCFLSWIVFCSWFFNVESW